MTQAAALQFEIFVMRDLSRRIYPFFAEVWGMGEQAAPAYRTRFHGEHAAALGDADRWLRSEVERLQTATG